MADKVCSVEVIDVAVFRLELYSRLEQSKALAECKERSLKFRQWSDNLIRQLTIRLTK